MKHNYSYMYNTYISGYRVFVSDHALERISTRMYNHGDYIENAMCKITKVLNNDYMYKYINNMMHYSRYENVDVLIYDMPEDRVYAIALKPDRKHIVLKTVGRCADEWLYANKKQRMCWIYTNAFVFSTANGNVTWN